MVLVEEARYHFGWLLQQVGAPPSGEQRHLASVVQEDEHQLFCLVHVDDIGVAIRAVAGKDPDHQIDYREYYIGNPLETLIRDVDRQHERLWPALQALFRNHESWGHPAVIEGWALRPAYVHALQGDISGLFLLADEALIERRVRASDFSQGASDVALMVRRYCQRSFWYNAYLRDEADRLDLKALRVSDEMRPDDIVDACLDLLSSNMIA